MPKSKERLFLLDAMALVYRAYFAYIRAPLRNSKGESTSAVFGFLSYLNKILDDEKPDHIAVVFDTAAPTFRHKMYKQYKATRQEIPEDMPPQIDMIKKIVKAYNIPLLELNGYEADDIIGTLAKRAEKEKVDTFLVTPDKDYMQLISDRVKMYKPGQQGNEAEIVSFEGVKAKFGVTPDKVIDVLALIGDKSDNVPGVPGVGEKTAIPLVQQWGSLENIIKNVEKIPQNGVREKIKANTELALLSKKLVTIEVNTPIKIDFHKLRLGEPDTAALRKYFQELEFRSLLNKLKKSSDGEEEASAEQEEKAVPADYTTIKDDKHKYHVVATEKDFKEFVKKLAKAKEFVFDTETTSKDALQSLVVGLSFSLKPREAYYVSVDASSQKFEKAVGDLFGDTPVSGVKQKYPTLPAKLVFPALKPIFENPKIKKIGQNVKYDQLALSLHDIWVDGIEFDTMIASYILRADGQHGLDAMAREHLQYSMVSFDDITGTGKERKDIREVPLEIIADYSCEDADIAYRLYEKLRTRVEKEKMMTLCDEIEFPLSSVLARMEKTGVVIDTKFLANMSKELERDIDAIVKQIYKLAGEKFNINSTQQLSEILFTKLKLPPVRKTKTGFSTDVSVLEELRHQHPIIEKMLDYRQLAKLKSTYVDALPKMVNPLTGRVHTSYNQTVAATGRLASNDPNLQNIPIRTEIGRSIRKAFVAGSKNSLIMSADYSQIELRIMAHVCDDKSFQTAFHNKEDIHATTAAKVFGVALKDVTKDMRRKAKEVNFGIMYGIGPFGLATRLDITQTEAKEIIDTYFTRFPRVKEFIENTKATVHKKGYVETLMGRRRYLPDIHSKNLNLRQHAERQSINMPIQGTAADMIKMAMVHIDAAMQKEKLKSAMLLQVHDELVFEVLKSEEAKMRKLVEKQMSGAMKLKVPIDVEIGVGKDWLEAH
ncbi:MAG: DNA polymerase I [Ignavibacteriae bacterium]|nr:DNA polymerase I [Ignavibacteriota bacterium]